MHYADELDPLNIGVKEIKAWVTFVSRQYDLALKQFENLGDTGGMVEAYKEKGDVSGGPCCPRKVDCRQPA